LINAKGGFLQMKEKQNKFILVNLPVSAKKKPQVLLLSPSTCLSQNSLQELRDGDYPLQDA